MRIGLGRLLSAPVDAHSEVFNPYPQSCMDSEIHCVRGWDLTDKSLMSIKQKPILHLNQEPLRNGVTDLDPYLENILKGQTTLCSLLFFVLPACDKLLKGGTLFTPKGLRVMPL